MSLNVKQQIIQAIKQAENILILFKNPLLEDGYPQGADVISASLALARIIEKNNKTAHIASDSFKAPKNLTFLQNIEKIKKQIRISGTTELSINIKNSGIKDFTYKIEDENLKIYFSPKTSEINLQSLKTKNGKLEYDLIINLGVENLNNLGDLYTKNKKLFDEIPIINIDNKPHNENYGDINFINLKASSICEMVWQVLKNSKNIDQGISDYLLTGLISKTKNFRTSNIWPTCLEVASELVELGADRKNIVNQLYRTKQIETLKLWGRTLARLKQDGPIIWSLLAKNDFIHSGADEEMLPDVIHELMSNSYDAKIFLIFFENMKNKPRVLIYSSEKNINIKDLNINYFAKKITRLKLPHNNIIEAEKELIKKIQETL